MGLQQKIGRRWEISAVVSDLIQSLTDRRRGGRSKAAADPAYDLVAMCDLLISRQGEATGAALAEMVLEQIKSSDGDRLSSFLDALVSRFGTDAVRLDAAIAAYQAAPGPATASALHQAAEPTRQELFRRINIAPGGTQALVRLREEVLRQLPSRPDLKVVDSDLFHLFTSWFNRGFLELRHIDWRTPASILERIIRYEAVHEIAGWDDLRRRLQPADRRCFAFFHPQMPEEPLIFVEVALTCGMATEMSCLLDPDRQPIAPESAQTAVFYSISNCQLGLRGISFGNLLIKQVVADLRRLFPNLVSFVTLSPMPGFAAWLDNERGIVPPRMLSREDVATLRALDSPDWMDAPSDALRATLLVAAARYMRAAKRADGKPVDPVSRFHLGNGARLEQIDFLADRSPLGMRQSYGVMVNYLYDPSTIELNHEKYADDAEVVVSAQVRKLGRTDIAEKQAV